MSPPLRNSVVASEGRSQGTQVDESGARERRVCGRQESMPKNHFEFHAENCRATNCLRWKGSRGFVRKNGCGIPQSRLRSGVSATSNAEPTTREAGHRFSSESGNGRISSTAGVSVRAEPDHATINPRKESLRQTKIQRACRSRTPWGRLGIRIRDTSPPPIRALISPPHASHRPAARIPAPGCQLCSAAVKFRAQRE